MAVSLTFLLIFTLITGTDGALTVIPAKAGASVTIPCLYESKYRNHVKYLCKGYYWNSCSYAIKTDSQQGSGKYSISDDKIQTIFNVTMKHLTVENTHYWCAVEINRGSDVRQYFQLSVTTGTPSLYVDNQEVTGFIGEDVTISCHYRTSKERKWCRLGRNCVTGVSGSIDGTTVNINTKEKSVFNVTMKGLMPKSSGWYYCDNGNFQMPVHLTVTAKPTTAPTTVTTAGEMTTEGQVQTTKGEKSEVSSFPVPLSLIIPLSLLIFIVAVALLFLFILRIKHAKAQDSTPSKLNEGEMTYSEVTFRKNKALQSSAAESDAGVIFSSAVPVNKQGVKRTDAKDEDVTYSTVLHHR
ncbi:CMRF35-like molecule 1 [Fundulus heteroclitus]|uniref:CMRF35-like molecule 1 n=1 Tax=Fundulus heteroclitus TaxID=8078 RepID=UPI00165CAC07|nr:CMRF35-like molecule 1 [Fundulus heteroclitus]